MSIHTTVCKLFVSLGYKETEGCCHGFSLRWIEACLLGEEPRFAERINTIVFGGEELVNSLYAVKEKKGRNLTKEDRTLLEIFAFYDSLEIYQSPLEHFSLFNVSLGQSDIEALSYYASSDKIKSLGGLVGVYSEPGIYTKEEIQEYLDSLALVLENTCVTSKEPLGIILTSYNHTIALTYKPGGAGWGFMDINQYPSQAFKIHEIDLVAERIVEGFFTQSDRPYSAFNTSIFTTANHLQLINLKEKLDQFAASHQLTKEIAGRVATNGVSLTFIAAQNGHALAIAALAHHGADLNQASKNGTLPACIAAQNGHVQVIAELGYHGADLNKAMANGATPALLSAQNGHASVVAELAKYKADLNQASNDGVTPVFLAAQNGHVPVVTELASHGVDLNKARNDGITPAFIAAQKGHAPVITELAKHGANLNKARNDGITPALMVAHNGDVSVIIELAEHGADLNKASNDGITPVFMAANHGHASVITVLAEKKADLNKANNDGVTPAFVAAQNGHASVVAELKRLGADFNIPYITTVDNLRQFARANGKRVITRMKQFIDQELSLEPQRQTIAMTPDQIAFVMGHGGIRQLEKKDAEEQDFTQALAQISSDRNNVDLTIKPYLEQLITQVNRLKKRGKEATADLTQILVATHERLHHNVDKKAAKDAPRKPSSEMKILGEIMIGLDAAIAVLGATSVLDIGAGAPTTLTGLGFFKEGTQKGLLNIRDDISERQSLNT